MLFIIGFVLVWIICGALSFGRIFAYEEMKFSNYSIQTNRKVAMILTPLGIIGLLVALHETWGSGCGWRFTDGCTWVKD
jgi:hypothetical protein